jgi:hypothetical protein
MFDKNSWRLIEVYCRDICTFLLGNKKLCIETVQCSTTIILTKIIKYELKLNFSN